MKASLKPPPELGTGFSICPMAPCDVDDVVAMAADVPTAPHWPSAEFCRMLEVIGHNPGRRGAWVARSGEGEAQGFAMVSHVAGVAELEAVVTAPRFRKHGVGRALAETVLNWANRLGAERVILEARASNGDALRLYERLGFKQDGVRVRYYRNPEEDAILMSRALR